MTNTSCRIGTVFSPDDGHIVARNMQRKVIDILRKFVPQVGYIYIRTHGILWNRNGVSAVRGRRQILWVMARYIYWQHTIPILFKMFVTGLWLVVVNKGHMETK